MSIQDILHEANLALSLLQDRLPTDNDEVNEAISMLQDAINKLVNSNLISHSSPDLEEAAANILKSLKTIQAAVDNLNYRIDEIEKKSKIKAKFLGKKPSVKKVDLVRAPTLTDFTGE